VYVCSTLHCEFDLSDLYFSSFISNRKSARDIYGIFTVVWKSNIGLILIDWGFYPSVVMQLSEFGSNLEVCSSTARKTGIFTKVIPVLIVRVVILYSKDLRNHVFR
jgi:hypothetical protein